MSGDDSEVGFAQPEEKAGAMEPDGSVPNRRKEEGWWEATEPYHGARPRTTEFERPVDDGLGATSGGLEEDVKLRDIVVPRLQPEQQIRLEEEVQDATAKGTTQERGSPTEGTEGHDGRIGVGSWGPGGPAERYSWSGPTEQQMVTCGGIGRYSVSYAARSRGFTDGKPIFEDAEGTSARAPGTTGGTYDNSTMV